MSKDDFDIYRHLRRDQGNNAALDLIQGLQDRHFGHFRNNVKAKENIEIFAEEQLVRKKDFDEMRCEMPGSPRSTFLMVFSSDGSRVASTHGNHNIYVTDIRSGKNIKTLIGHPRTPWCIAFHPTSDQIVASGCLGGQVRIWDLSGGSEVWTAGSQSVIASIAFHPNDRVLVIATYNEVYFWDWSQPEPFVHAATSSPKEKVRYVAFDKLGHKLITGIANSPQTRWERVRAPVPVPRQERCASPYRRRITQRLVNMASSQNASPSDNTASNREPLSSAPERERRITVYYRTLVREYEQLVQRYLQLYRPPTMIDRGTDPMEPNPWFNNSGTQTTEPSTSGTSEAAAAGPSAAAAIPGTAEPTVQNNSEVLPQSNSAAIPPPDSNVLGNEPSTSGTSNDNSQAAQSTSHSLLTPSRIFSVIKKPNTLIRGTQTLESRKHKAEEMASTSSQEKRFKKSNRGTTKSSKDNSPDTGKSEPENKSNSSKGCEKCGDPVVDTASQQSEMGTQTQSSRRLLVINLQKLKAAHDTVPSLPVTESSAPNQPSTSGCRIRCTRRQETTDPSSRLPSQESAKLAGPVSSSSVQSSSNRGSNVTQNSVDELLTNIRRTAEEEVRNRILPIIRSVPANDRPVLLRLFENNREHVRMRFRQMCSIFLKKSNHRPLNVTDTTSDSSSSDEGQSSSPNNRLMRRNSEPTSNTNDSSIPNLRASNPSPNSVSNSNPNVSQSGSSTSSTVRNFNTELEQLVTSLLTEIERNETESTASITNNTNTVQTTGSADTNTAVTDSVNSSSARVRPTPTVQSSASAPQASFQNDLTSCPPVRNPQLGHLFQEFLQLQNLTRESVPTSSSSTPTTTASVAPVTIVNTNTRTTNSTIYTTSNSAPRRRFFSHRVSAFMPTRVYTRTPVRLRRNTHHMWGRGRLGSRIYGTASFALDELINYSERENSEDDPPQPQWNFHPFDLSEFPSANPEGNGIGNIYSSIVQDLESSLNDVRNIRATNRPGETSDMLSSFSERLENIMNQSDTILRNLSSSMDMLNSTPETGGHRSQGTEPSWSFFDQNFYVRDQRTDSVNSEVNTNETLNLRDLFNSSPFSAIASDHTYPRNPDGAQASPQNDNMTPLMTSLRLTISHIQRQARLLRQQVEGIERIDRALLEVTQLQLLRQLIIELVRHVRAMTGERPGTGMSSVRQMMAGTRISDSSPYDSPLEEASTQNTQPPHTSRDNPSTSEQSSSVPTRPRASNRKTYPPSRLFRLARQCRRPSIVHFFSRRYMNRNERGVRQNPQSRPANSRPPQDSSNHLRNQSFSNYYIINNSTLSLMMRRLEHLLADQSRIFARPQETPPNNRSTATIDLGEHILSLRLHGCVLRMIRVLGLESSAFRNVRMDPSSAVTQDGVARYGARHTLSLIVDGMSRHVEELDGSNITQSMRVQILGVLAMSLLLTELLSLIVVDSIPPPSGMNVDPEQESLTTRIDQMCGQMLQTQYSGHSHQLTRSLRLMRLTMRHAYRALGQTYNIRRSAMIPRHTDREQLLGSINRCLRNISRRRQSENSGQETSGEATTENSNSTNPTFSNTSPNGEWYNTVSDLIMQYLATNREEEPNNQPSTSTRERGQPQRDAVSSNNDNSDGEDNDDESEWYGNNNSTSHNSNLYRTNNVNLVQSTESPSQPPRWNVPSVQVNDIPVSEPSVFGQRLMSQRQRFAERVSELRSNPTMSLFRPRFLHPLYASVNPFDADLDDPQRDQIYDSDMITTVTPNHRIQAWDISNWNIPVISNSLKNIVVSECKIHNDASVDVAKDGTILVTLLPSGGYLNVTNRLGVYSLRWETLGQCLYTTNFEQNAVSVSLSPLSRHLVVGLASRRVSIMPSDRWVMARIFKIDQKDVPGDRLPVLRELEQNRDSRINCIRWLPSSGQGLIYATNTGQLVVLS